MVVHDPGDAQRAKHTSPTHNQHDSSKDKALEGANGPNRKEIGAKPKENDKNSEITVDIAVAAAADASSKQTQEAIDADAAMAMELELELANYSSTEGVFQSARALKGGETFVWSVRQRYLLKKLPTITC